MERVYTTPLLDKLGVRPGMRVALIDVDDETIRPLLAGRTSDITEGWPEPDTDVVFLGADSTAALEPLGALGGRIRPNGAIWVVSRKGKAATLRDIDVMAAARTPVSSTTRSWRSLPRIPRFAWSFRSPGVPRLVARCTIRACPTCC